MILIYKCPNCGGNMKFNSDKQLLHCDYCGTESKVEEVEVREEEESRGTEENLNTRLYECPSCGAEIITDEYTAATYCAYCGSATILRDRLSNSIKPNTIIPFKYNREKALSKIKKWCHNGLFTPSDFLSENNIQKLSGIYVPFWLYDFDTNADIRANCTRVRVYRRGDREYTETSHYLVERNIDAEFNRIPYDSSIKMDDELMDLLEPFDYKEIKEFDMGYLSGYMAEKFNYEKDYYLEKARNEAKLDAKNLAMSTISGYSSVVVTSSVEQANLKRIEYCLLPVWIYRYVYNGETYTFAMNGQTGKVIGKPPVSKGKTIAIFLSIFIAVVLIMYIIFYIVGGLS